MQKIQKNIGNIGEIQENSGKRNVIKCKFVVDGKWEMCHNRKDKKIQMEVEYGKSQNYPGG